MNFYDFQERLKWSDGNGPTLKAVLAIIKNRIPGCTMVRRAGCDADRSGTDYFADRENGHPLSIDLKAREKDCQQFGNDDLALETWSVVPSEDNHGKPGWTRDPMKLTDYILWYWVDSGRFCLVGFPELCFVFDRLWEEWRDEYGSEIQNSGGWQSECVFVPRDVVSEAIDRWGNGAYSDAQEQRTQPWEQPSLFFED